MATRSREHVDSRVPLSRERVLRAAICLADTGGIESLTMRKLGQELGVEAMSLYNHVANKNDILSGILEMVHGEIELPCREDDWKSAIRRTSISAHEVLLRHPWACSLMLSAVIVSPARLRWMDSVLRTLRESGFSAELTHHAYHALDSHIVGFTLWIVSLPALGDELKDLAADFIEDFPTDEYPHLAEHIDYHVTEPSRDDDEEGEFEFGLDLILEGLERMRDAT